MTRQKHLKALIRARAAETGKSYAQTKEEFVAETRNRDQQKTTLPDLIQIQHTPNFDPCSLNVPTWKVDAFHTSTDMLQSSMSHEAKALYAYKAMCQELNSETMKVVVGWSGDELIFKDDQSPETMVPVTVTSNPIDDISGFKIYKFSVKDRVRYFYADFTTFGSPVFDGRYCTPLKMTKEYLADPNLLGLDIMKSLGLEVWDKSLINKGTYDQWSLHYGCIAVLGSTPTMAQCAAQGVSAEVIDLAELMIAAQAVTMNTEEVFELESSESVVDHESGATYGSALDVCGEIYCFPHKGKRLIWEYDVHSGIKRFAYVNKSLSQTHDLLTEYLVSQKNDVDTQIFDDYHVLINTVLKLLELETDLTEDLRSYTEMLIGLHSHANETTTIGRILTEYKHYPVDYLLHEQLEIWITSHTARASNLSLLRYKDVRQLNSWQEKLPILVEIYQNSSEKHHVQQITDAIYHYQYPDPRTASWLNTFRNLDLVKHSVTEISQWVLE